MAFDTSDDRFGAYADRLSDLAQYKRDEPKRAWENLESLHNQAVSGALDNTSEFKQARRDWNRQYKNTPVGIMASGVDLDANPFGAQDLYHDMSSQLAYDAPTAYDEMYPIQPGKIFSAIAENIGPMSWLKNILPKREKITPENVLEMRKRFPGIDKLVPGGGLSELVPEHLRQKAIFDINETVEEGEGIFGGRGEFSSDFDYEEDREGRERSEKIVFLQSINPSVDYNKVMPELIDVLYEEALAKVAQEEEFMHGNIGSLNPLQPD